MANTLFEPIRVTKTINISEILGQHINNWAPQASNKCYSLVDLDEDSSEYIEIENAFDSSMCSYSITSIKRVQNPYLLCQYLLKKQQLSESNYRTQEKRFFHGTSEDTIDSICTNNYDWRRCGTARGHKFGQGVSFAVDAFYSSHYGQPSGSTRFMFYSNVLVTKTSFGGRFTTLPENGCDTTCNHKYSVYVKYEDNDFYPGYLIHYN